MRLETCSVECELLASPGLRVSVFEFFAIQHPNIQLSSDSLEGYRFLPSRDTQMTRDDDQDPSRRSGWQAFER